MIDLNNTEVEKIEQSDFLKFSEIYYPKILKDNFVISLPVLVRDDETIFLGALSNMLGVFPARYYTGFFSKTKSKIRKWPIKYSIHDVLKCKVPDFAIMDSSEKGVILAGLPQETDKQAAKLLGLEWKDVAHLKLVEEMFLEDAIRKEKQENKEKQEEAIPNVIN